MRWLSIDWFSSLFWIPSHIGIRGNEAADVAAKESLDQDITAGQVPYTDGVIASSNALNRSLTIAYRL